MTHPQFQPQSHSLLNSEQNPQQQCDTIPIPLLSQPVLTQLPRAHHGFTHNDNDDDNDESMRQDHNDNNESSKQAQAEQQYDIVLKEQVNHQRHNQIINHIQQAENGQNDQYFQNRQLNDEQHCQNRQQNGEQNDKNYQQSRNGQSATSEYNSGAGCQIKIEQEYPADQCEQQLHNSQNNVQCSPKAASKPIQTLHRSISATTQSQFLLTDDHKLITTIIQSSYSSITLISPYLHNILTQSQSPLFETINIYQSVLNARELPELLKGIFFDGAGLFAHLKQTELIQFNTVRKQKRKQYNGKAQYEEDSQTQSSYFVNFYVKQVLPDDRVVTRTCQIQMHRLKANQQILEQVKIKKWKSLEQKFVKMSQELQNWKSQYQRVAEELDELKQSIPKITKKQTSKQKKTSKGRPKKQINAKHREQQQKREKPRQIQQQYEQDVPDTRKPSSNEKDKRSSSLRHSSDYQHNYTKLSSSISSIMHHDTRPSLQQSSHFTAIKQQQHNQTYVNNEQLAEIYVQMPTSQPDSDVQVKTEQQLQNRAYMNYQAILRNKRVHWSNYNNSNNNNKEIISISDSSCVNNNICPEQSQTVEQNRIVQNQYQHNKHSQHQQRQQRQQFEDQHELYAEIDQKQLSHLQRQQVRPQDQRSTVKHEQSRTIQNKQQQKKRALRSHKNAILSIISKNKPKPINPPLQLPQLCQIPLPQQQQSLASLIPKTPTISMNPSNITYTLSSNNYYTLSTEYMKLQPPPNATVSLCLKCDFDFGIKKRSMKEQLSTILIYSVQSVLYMLYHRPNVRIRQSDILKCLPLSLHNLPITATQVHPYYPNIHRHVLIGYTAKCDQLVQAINRHMKKLRKFVIIYPKDKKNCAYGMSWCRYIGAHVDVKFVQKDM